MKTIKGIITTFILCILVLPVFAQLKGSKGVLYNLLKLQMHIIDTGFKGNHYFFAPTIKNLSHKNDTLYCIDAFPKLKTWRSIQFFSSKAIIVSEDSILKQRNKLYSVYYIAKPLFTSEMKSCKITVILMDEYKSLSRAYVMHTRKSGLGCKPESTWKYGHQYTYTEYGYKMIAGKWNLFSIDKPNDITVEMEQK
ncbi:MAG TPA: hypothetical protein VK808_07145 [Bacteroidia bacterium]|jgi:hypothetical protein|nr:hypothetical protein [Bacteroidia bacterium]